MTLKRSSADANKNVRRSTNFRCIGELTVLCQQLIDDAKSCIQPGYDYFNSRFDGELKILVSAARYFDPSKINELKPTLSDIDSLKVLPFIKNPLITNLKTELPAYMSKAEDVSPTSV